LCSFFVRRFHRHDKADARVLKHTAEGDGRSYADRGCWMVSPILAADFGGRETDQAALQINPYTNRLR
jgi:hypothetical protein